MWGVRRLSGRDFVTDHGSHSAIKDCSVSRPASELCRRGSRPGEVSDLRTIPLNLKLLTDSTALSERRAEFLRLTACTGASDGRQYKAF